MELAEVIRQLLPPGEERSVAHLVAELEVEYPALWRAIREHYRKEYSLSQCGTRQSPRTAVAQALEELAARGVVEGMRKGREVLWRRKIP